MSTMSPVNNICLPFLSVLGNILAQTLFIFCKSQLSDRHTIIFIQHLLLNLLDILMRSWPTGKILRTTLKFLVRLSDFRVWQIGVFGRQVHRIDIHPRLSATRILYRRKWSVACPHLPSTDQAGWEGTGKDSVVGIPRPMTKPINGVQRRANV